MSSHVLIWAGVPHNSDGIVFQVRVVHGLQRFYMSRRVLEDAFELEPRASDARQLELFYTFLTHILARASSKRPIAGSDTVALQSTDFIPSAKRKIDRVFMHSRDARHKCLRSRFGMWDLWGGGGFA